MTVHAEMAIDRGMRNGSLPAKAALPSGDAIASIREAALSPGYERDVLYEEHPIVKNAARIATLPLRETYDVVAQTIVHRDTGTCLIGDFRMGKTTAQAIIVDTLRDTFPNLPVGRVIAKGHDVSTEKGFYTDLLVDFGHDSARVGTASERRMRIFTAVLAQARQQKSSRHLLLVDEGQNWGEAELTYLRDLVNDWQAQSLAVITIIFAHPALEVLRQRLLGKRRTDLIGRFLLSPLEFRGIRDRDELRDTLKAHDDPGRHEYPERSGISYSEFFMPVAWGAGWRLESEVFAMWDAFGRVAARSQRTARNIGMNWVAGAIRNFFFSQAPHDGLGFSATTGIWLEAIEACGYEASLV